MIDPREAALAILSEPNPRPEAMKVWWKYAVTVARALLAVPSPSTDGGDGKDNNAAAGAAPFDPWQSIGDVDERNETLAPFDGGHVLVGSKSGAWVCSGYWEPERCCFFEVGSHWTDQHDGSLLGATHWMPLPVPPGKAASSPTSGVTNER